MQNLSLYSSITGEAFVSWTSLDGLPRRYWPGGKPNGSFCACGQTGSCRGLSGQKCNCADPAASASKDFGVITDKSELPMMSLTQSGDLRSSSRSTATVVIGWLGCAPRQFGVESSCQAYRALGHVDSNTYLIDPDGPPKRAGTGWLMLVSYKIH